jgi:pyruvate-ferredoxin/flavodoxin oxidoreductase
MGANYNQLLKAMLEAESYKGPSIIIAYSPCISHGLKKGMGKTQEDMKDAVAAGYWHLYRYNPDKAEQGENPFTLDQKEPTENFRDYIMNRPRYSALVGEFPEEADRLSANTEKNAQDRLAVYQKMARD